MISTWKNVMTLLIWGDKTLINKRRTLMKKIVKKRYKGLRISVQMRSEADCLMKEGKDLPNHITVNSTTSKSRKTIRRYLREGGLQVVLVKRELRQ